MPQDQLNPPPFLGLVINVGFSDKVISQMKEQRGRLLHVQSLVVSYNTVIRGLLHPQTSQKSQSRVENHHTTTKSFNLGWTNVTTSTNVTNFKTSQTLRTTNVTKRHNMSCAFGKQPHCSLCAKPEVIINIHASISMI